MAPPSFIRFEQPNIYFIEGAKKEKIELGGEGAKWPLEMRHAVMLTNCEDCAVVLKNKCTKVELSHCKKIQISVPSVLSSVDMQNSSSCEIHVLERCPGLAIDECHSMSLYIPRDSMEFIEIASSGGGSATLMVPKKEDPTEFTEYPIPFQYVHKFKGEKLCSEISPLYTH